MLVGWRGESLTARVSVHLHGHVFQVVGRGDGYYDANATVPLNVSNPLRRDTVHVPGEGFAILRFRADNPGVWVSETIKSMHTDSDMCKSSFIATLNGILNRAWQRRLSKRRMWLSSA